MVLRRLVISGDETSLMPNIPGRLCACWPFHASSAPPSPPVSIAATWLKCVRSPQKCHLGVALQSIQQRTFRKHEKTDSCTENPVNYKNYSGPKREKYSGPKSRKYGGPKSQRSDQEICGQEGDMQFHDRKGYSRPQWQCDLNMFF